MDSSFGVQGKDFVIIASDSAVLRSIMKLHVKNHKILLSLYFLPHFNKN